MPNPDPKVTVPSDEELKTLSHYLDGYSWYEILDELLKVRDHTREATIVWMKEMLDKRGCPDYRINQAIRRAVETQMGERKNEKL